VDADLSLEVTAPSLAADLCSTDKDNAPHKATTLALYTRCVFVYIVARRTLMTLSCFALLLLDCQTVVSDNVSYVDVQKAAITLQAEVLRVL